MNGKKIDFLGLVRKHAEENGYRVSEVFARAGVSYSNWGRWVRGETSPSIRVLDRLLEVPPKEAGRA